MSGYRQPPLQLCALCGTRFRAWREDMPCHGCVRAGLRYRDPLEPDPFVQRLDSTFEAALANLPRTYPRRRV